MESLGGLEAKTVSPDAVRLENTARSYPWWVKASAYLFLTAFTLGITSGKAKADSKKPYCKPLSGYVIDQNAPTMQVQQGESVNNAIDAAALEHYKDSNSQKRFRFEAKDYADDGFDMNHPVSYTCELPLGIPMLGYPPEHRFTVDSDSSNSSNPGASDPGALNPGAANQDSDKDGYTPAQGDCNDSNPAINPKAKEIYRNGIDDDCNAATKDEPNQDNKGAAGAAKDAALNYTIFNYFSTVPGKIITGEGGKDIVDVKKEAGEKFGGQVTFDDIYYSTASNDIFKLSDEERGISGVYIDGKLVGTLRFNENGTVYEWHEKGKFGPELLTRAFRVSNGSIRKGQLAVDLEQVIKYSAYIGGATAAGISLGYQPDDSSHNDSPAPTNPGDPHAEE